MKPEDRLRWAYPETVWDNFEINRKPDLAEKYREKSLRKLIKQSKEVIALRMQLKVLAEEK